MLIIPISTFWHIYIYISIFVLILASHITVFWGAFWGGSSKISFRRKIIVEIITYHVYFMFQIKIFEWTSISLILMDFPKFNFESIFQGGLIIGHGKVWWRGMQIFFQHIIKAPENKTNGCSCYWYVAIHRRKQRARMIDMDGI